MKKNYFLLMIVLAFCSCQKDVSNIVAKTTEVDVYVAGYENDGFVPVAKYWKNGQAVPLGDGTHFSVALSIAVVGSDVYVAGYEDNGNFYVAKYWKNRQVTELTDGTNEARANSIVVVKQ